MNKNVIYITGAGVSTESGIPTFRGEDGFWTIGSKNFTPQDIATRKMYLSQPDEFLLWYFKRFVSYRNIQPNTVHFWLSDKNLITQNIDGLDGKAGNKSYIPIHGRLDKISVLHEQGISGPIEDAPWDTVIKNCKDLDHKHLLKVGLLDAFKISQSTLVPEQGVSLKPFVLLFDEYYTELYRISEAEKRMRDADFFVFMGTSFSVNVTNSALRYALANGASIDVVDLNPIELGLPSLMYFPMSATDYVATRLA